MKKSYLIPKGLWVLAAVLLTVGFAGCDEKEPDLPTQPYLNILYNNGINNNLTLQADKDGDDFEIAVESSRNWKMAALTETWISVNPQKGNKDKVTSVDIHLDANPGAERNVTLLFTTADGANERKVVINQYGEGSVPVGDLIYFEDLGDFKSGAEIRTLSGIDTSSSTWPTITQYGSVDPTGIAWRRGGNVNQSAVTYDGTAQVRNSGSTYDPDSDSDISGAAYIVMGSGFNFLINGVDLGGKTDLVFKFSAQNTASVTEYVPSFGPVDNSTLKLEAGFDGAEWATLSITAAEAGASWYWATSEFKVPSGTEKLYFRFSGFTGSSLRLDDFTLSEGGNGELITPGGSTGDLEEITIKQLNDQISETKTAIGNYYLKGVVTTDMAGGNFTNGALSIMAEGATAAGNGILLYAAYGSNIKFEDAEGDPLFAAGDKIEVDLSAMSLLKYRGKGAQATDPYCNEIEIPAGTDLTKVIKKTGTATVTPVTVTYDQLADYQNMVVQIAKVQSEAINITKWAKGSTYFTYEDDVETSFPVYLADGSNIIDEDFSTKNGTIIGVSYVYAGSSSARSVVQLVPRSMADLAGLTDDRIGGGSVIITEDGKNILLYENMGYTPVSATTNINTYTGWAKAGAGTAAVTYGTTDAGSAPDIRSTSVSTGYDQASGGNNVFFASGEANLGKAYIIEGVALNGATELILGFGVNAVASALTVEYKADSGEWTPVEYTKTTASWGYVLEGITVAEGTQTLSLRFTSVASCRLDDVTLSTDQTIPSFLNVPLTTYEILDVAGESVTVPVFSNVDWTLNISQGEDMLQSTPSAGTGNGTISLVFKANNNPDAGKTFKMTVSTTAAATPASYEVVVTQAKADIYATYFEMTKLPFISGTSYVTDKSGNVEYESTTINWFCTIGTNVTFGSSSGQFANMVLRDKLAVGAPYSLTATSQAAALIMQTNVSNIARIVVTGKPDADLQMGLVRSVDNGVNWTKVYDLASIEKSSTAIEIPYVIETPVDNARYAIVMVSKAATAANSRVQAFGIKLQTLK